jgi:decaprenyl-phosphate phosphoribosyltransferase
MKYLELLRIKEWIKNLFVYIPVFFAGEFYHSQHHPELFLCFLSFCMIASGIYIFNDYKDKEEDRLHPKKKNRPIAAGTVSLKIAFGIMAVLFAAGFIIGYLLSINVLLILLLYCILNLAYSLGLKHISILDVFILSSGFLFRVIAGGMVAQVPISQWLIIMVFLLALFLALAKRRDDLLIYLDSNKIIRKSVLDYNMDFLNTMLAILGAIIIVSYIMYTITPEVTVRFQHKYVYATVIYVFAGIMRYLQIIYIKKDSGSPTLILYRDKFIIATLFCWILHFFVIIYLKNNLA